jgi:predicted dehydrogenase
VARESGAFGGGELMDQGVHLIDLARWFLGDFSEVTGFAHTFFGRCR